MRRSLFFHHLIVKLIALDTRQLGFCFSSVVPHDIERQLTPPPHPPTRVFYEISNLTFVQAVAQWPGRGGGKGVIYHDNIFVLFIFSFGYGVIVIVI